MRLLYQTQAECRFKCQPLTEQVTKRAWTSKFYGLWRGIAGCDFQCSHKTVPLFVVFYFEFGNLFVRMTCQIILLPTVTDTNRVCVWWDALLILTKHEWNMAVSLLISNQGPGKNVLVGPKSIALNWRMDKSEPGSLPEAGRDSPFHWLLSINMKINCGRAIQDPYQNSWNQSNHLKKDASILSGFENLCWSQFGLLVFRKFFRLSLASRLQAFHFKSRRHRHSACLGAGVSLY